MMCFAVTLVLESIQRQLYPQQPDPSFCYFLQGEHG